MWPHHTRPPWFLLSHSAPMPLHSPLESSDWSDSNRAQLGLDMVTGIRSSQAAIVPSRMHKLQQISPPICPHFACFSILTEMHGKPQDFPCLIPSSGLLLYYKYIYIYMLFVYSIYSNYLSIPSTSKKWNYTIFMLLCVCV